MLCGGKFSKKRSIWLQTVSPCISDVLVLANDIGNVFKFHPIYSQIQCPCSVYIACGELTNTLTDLCLLSLFLAIHTLLTPLPHLPCQSTEQVDHIVVGTVIQEVKTSNIAREVGPNVYIPMKTYPLHSHTVEPPSIADTLRTAKMS